MSEAFQDSKDAIVDCVFKFIDRMNDVCEEDTADRIVSEYIDKMNPLIDEYLDLKFAPNHGRHQLWLEFRSPEELEEDEVKREARRRSSEKFFDELRARRQK